MKRSEPWLALVIGNTRLHWGYFDQAGLLGSWHTPHLTEAIAASLQQAHFTAEGWESLTDWSGPYTETERAALPQAPLSPENIWVASAVPAQSNLWKQPHRMASIVTRSHIPLSGMYPTLGIDRAINLLGAGELVGYPVLVIDAGTAITLTAGVAKSVYGGAILPGLRLQTESLAQKTASLQALIPSFDADPNAAPVLPTRWAKDTEGAIASGLIYSLTATLTDYILSWWQQFPAGQVVLTGGDAPQLHSYLIQQENSENKRTPEIVSRVQVNSDLMFYGMQVYCRERMLLA
ncbi:MAG: pantothenate kinase [Cyanobacteria bacterium J06560_6]